MAQTTTQRSSWLPHAPSFEKALVADAMTREVITCPADAPLRWVAGVMAAERVHCVVIEPRIDEDERGTWTLISVLDLVGAAGSDLDAATAGGVAASEFLTITPEEKLERAAHLMAEHEAAHLVVVDLSSGRPIGVVSTLDVANALARVEVAA
jgi:predicted transcriptional regulator